MIATVLKFGDRTHIGAVHLASSLAALIQLVGAGLVWFFATQPGTSGVAAGLTPGNMASIVSLAAGAVLANIVSIIIMIVETSMQRR